jgi:hypothetical protein
MHWTDGSHRKEDAPYPDSRGRVAHSENSIRLVTGLADVSEIGS